MYINENNIDIILKEINFFLSHLNCSFIQGGCDELYIFKFRCFFVQCHFHPKKKLHMAFTCVIDFYTSGGSKQTNNKHNNSVNTHPHPHPHPHTHTHTHTHINRIEKEEEEEENGV